MALNLGAVLVLQQEPVSYLLALPTWCCKLTAQSAFACKALTADSCVARRLVMWYATGDWCWWCKLTALLFAAKRRSSTPSWSYCTTRASTCLRSTLRSPIRYGRAITHHTRASIYLHSNLRSLLSYGDAFTNCTASASAYLKSTLRSLLNYDDAFTHCTAVASIYSQATLHSFLRCARGCIHTLCNRRL